MTGEAGTWLFLKQVGTSLLADLHLYAAIFDATDEATLQLLALFCH